MVKHGLQNFEDFACLPLIRESDVKIVLFGIRGLLGGGIALNDENISYSTTETSGY